MLIKVESSRKISENSQIANFMKFHPMEAELLHADRETQKDRKPAMPKLEVPFCNFVNAPKKKVAGEA
jgi:hypothetical protein